MNKLKSVVSGDKKELLYDFPLARRKSLEEDSAMPRHRSASVGPAPRSRPKTSRVVGSSQLSLADVKRKSSLERASSLRKLKQGEKTSKSVSFRRGSTGSMDDTSRKDVARCQESSSTLRTEVTASMYDSLNSSFSSVGTVELEESALKSPKRPITKSRTRRRTNASSRKRDDLRSVSEHAPRVSNKSGHLKARRTSRRSSLDAAKIAEPHEASERLLEMMKTRLEAVESRLRSTEKELLDAFETIAEIQSTRKEEECEEYSDPDDYEFKPYYGNTSSSSLLRRFSLR